MEKARQESEKHHKNVVLLIPARTDTSYFHEQIFGHAQVRFVRGRLKFELEDGTPGGAAPFASAIIVYKGDCNEKEKDAQLLPKKCH